MCPADLQFGLEIGEDEAGILEIEDRLAERLAVAGEFNGVVERALRAGLRRDGDGQPLLRQFAHQIDEALALFAQAVGDRHADVVEEQFRRIRLVLTDLVEVATALEPFAVRFDQHDRDALVSGLDLGVGLDADEDQIGVLAIGDIGFAAVDDVVVAILLRRRPHPLQVGTCAGFSHGDGGDDFARDHFGQPFALLLVRPVSDQIIDDDVGLQRKAGGGAAIIGAFLIDDSIIAEVEAEPAELFGDGRAQHTQLARLGPDRLGDDAILRPLRGIGGDFGFKELADGAAKRLMILAIGRARDDIERHTLS